MNKSLYGAILILSPAAAIACGVAWGPVLGGWPWTYFGINAVYGMGGLAVGVAATYAVLRRRDLALTALAIGPFALVFGGVTPAATSYHTLMLHRDRPIVLDAAALATFAPGRPVRAVLSGVWRYDLAARGTYLRSGPPYQDAHTCDVFRHHYCRAPIVGEAWRPGDPVLAISADCPDEADAPIARTAEVTLYAADREWSVGALEVDRRDPGEPAGHVSCLDRDDDGRADLAHAPFPFDPARGVIAVEAERRHPDDPIGLLIFDGLYLLAVLSIVLRRSWREARITRQRELDDAAARS